MRVRFAVHENQLLNPDSIKADDCIPFLTKRGKGWVCEIDGNVIGFSIADLQDDNVWALFVDPKYEKQGIGKQLHKLMLNWYFEQGKQHIWLSTDPGTRAEQFYIKQGWTPAGPYENGEVKFTMSVSIWTGLKPT